MRIKDNMRTMHVPATVEKRNLVYHNMIFLYVCHYSTHLPSNFTTVLAVLECWWPSLAHD